MGSTWIAGFLEDGNIPLEKSLELHLRYNHYPPLPLSMIQPCIDAINNANSEEWDKEVDLPEGIFYKGKFKTAPTSEIIEAHHLDTFLDYVD